MDMTERKSYAITDFKSDNNGSFSGVLSTYGNVDFVGDICMPGCFDNSVAEKGTKRPMLWQHDPGEPIGSFDIVDTKDNLSIAGRFNLDVMRGRDAHSLLKAGDINGLSIGFRLKDYAYDGDGHRLIKSVDLMEGSFVTFPANPMAYAEAKSMAGNIRAEISALETVKGLDDAVRHRLMKAIDTALAGADASEEIVGSPTIAEEDTTALADGVKALKASVDGLSENIRK